MSGALNTIPGAADQLAQDNSQELVNTQFTNELLDSASRIFSEILRQKGVIVENSIQSEFNASMRISAENLVENIKYSINHQTRRAQVLANQEAASPEEVQTLFRNQFSQHLDLMASALASHLQSPASGITRNANEPGNVITSSNLPRVNTLMLGLSIGFRDPSYTELISGIAAVSEQNNGLTDTLLETIFTTIKDSPSTSVVQAIQLAATQLNTQGLSQVSQNSLLNAANILLLLSTSQKAQLITYALNKVSQDPDGTAKVLSELTYAGVVPVSTVTAEITRFMQTLPADSPAKVMLQALIPELEAGAVRMQQVAAQVSQQLLDSALIAGIDISNPALSGGKWAAFFAFYYGVISAVISVGLGVSSGDVAGGVTAALPTAAVATAAFANIGGTNLRDIPGRIANILELRKSQREQINQNQWVQSVSEAFIQNQPIQVVSFFAHPQVIQHLRFATDQQSDVLTLNIDRFEDFVAGLNPAMQSVYAEYAGQFRTNRPALVANLALLSSSINALNIENTQQFATQFLTPNQISVDQLTNFE